MASGNYSLEVETDTIAYPLDADYFPRVVVYKTTYAVGDCPIDDAILGFSFNEEDTQIGWTTTDARITITENLVRVMDESDRPFVSGDTYEIRIYQSNEVIPTAN